MKVTDERGAQAGAGQAKGEALSPRDKLVRDAMASSVVFLVALPLCIGIAVACNVPVERGLITGIVGGAIGVISGAPLLVSGPAASLIVPCFALVEQYGLVALAPVVMLTGVWQMLAGYLRLGQWFRAVAPAVITGMLTGIGVLIIGSQSLVALDADPRAGFVENVAAVPELLFRTATGAAGTSPAPFFITVATIGLIVGWTQFRPEKLSIIPGHLVALLSVTSGAYFFAPEVRVLDISSNFFAGLGPPALGDFSILLDPVVIGKSAMFAFVASAATLLTANAIDERQNIVKTNYDQEMKAQGVGNFLTGLLGGLPMTGVIVRSSVNVDAGAQTRRSTIFHAIWILAFVSLAPQLLGLIPRACLGAILVYTGVKLVDVGAMGRLWEQGRAEFVIFSVTFIGVVFVDLFAGILAGLGTAAAKIVWTFSHLEISREPGPSEGIVHMHLRGSATFIQLPRLARELDGVPEDTELHVHIERLDHIDHACLQLLYSVSRQREAAGYPGIRVEWEELRDRYRNALVGTGPTHARPSANIVNLVWAEWKRVHAETRPEAVEHTDRWDRWIGPDAVVLRATADTLEDVLELAAPRLAVMTDLEPDRVFATLASRVDGHVPLGDGVSLPHAAIEGIEHSRVVVVTTAAPVVVGDDAIDIFFVLLSPAGDAAEHLRALAHIGRMCHRSPLLGQLRKASDADYAATVLDALGRAAARGDRAHEQGLSLALVSVRDETHARELQAELSEAFAEWAVVTESERAMMDMLRRLGGEEGDRVLLVASIERHEEALLRALVEEANKLNAISARLTFLRTPIRTETDPAAMAATA